MPPKQIHIEYADEETFEMRRFKNTLKEVVDWIYNLDKNPDEFRKKMAFNYLYAYYRNMEGQIKNLTSDLTEKQWDLIGVIRNLVENYWKTYDPRRRKIDEP